MKSRSGWLSYALMSLPTLFLLICWPTIPNPVAVHFTEQGEAEKIISRQEWMISFACIAIQLILTRSMLFMLLRPYTNQHSKRFMGLYWLSAGFVGVLTGLYIAEAVYQRAIYTNTLPILMALGEAGLVHGIMPDHLPIRSSSINLTAQQMRASTYVYTISRLLLIWVNALTGLMLLFVPGADRWQLGMTANLLICSAILLMGALSSFYANQPN